MDFVLQNRHQALNVALVGRLVIGIRNGSDTCKRLLAFFVFVQLLRRWRRKPRKSFKGKIILITGGAMGIGKLMARRLARQGAKVVLWDLNETVLQDTVTEFEREFPGLVKGYICDVTNGEIVREVAGKVQNEVGPVSILINNAGIVSGKPLLQTTDRQNEMTLKVNSLAPMLTTKAFLPTMLERNDGHIVTIASLAGFMPLAGLADYCASKHAAVGFHRSLEMELPISHPKKKIHTTMVNPFYISTGMFEGVKTGWACAMLRPRDVAERVVEAIAANEREIFLPSVFQDWIPLIALMPRWMQMVVYEGTRSNRAMDQFKGH